MTDDAVLYARTGHVGVLTLNRPEGRNSMTGELLDAFAAAIDRVLGDTEARALVLVGTGRCFSAGADLKAGLQRAAPDTTPADASFAMYTPFLRLLEVQVPVIAALNGHAVGGGFGLSLLADLRIANRDAKYGANFARLGIHSGLGISFLLPRLVGLAHASELLFTGRLISGARAADIGLCSQAVAADEVLPTAIALAEEIAQAAPLPVRQMKQTMRAALGWDITTTARAEAALQAASLQTEDAKEGMAALLDKRSPSFHGR